MDTAVGSLIALVAIAAALWFGIRWLIRSFSRYSGQRIVTCPETKKPTIVKVDSLHASLTSTVGHPDIRLKDCSRWPIKKECGQECLTQLDVAPDSCLVSGVLIRWYRGRSCGYCAKPFAEINWLDHQPALLSPGGKLVRWKQVNIDNLEKVLETHSPVCWDCYIAQTFRLDHPDLVTLRPWRNNVDKPAGHSSGSIHP
jgi:hypothetical protein